MGRYFSRPRSIKTRAEWDDDVPLVPNIDVPEHEDRFTGLLDASGGEIWCAPRPIGFGRTGEW